MGVADFMTRAIKLGNSGSPNGSRKLVKPALGNLANTAGQGGGGGKVAAATQNITWASEGQPLSLNWTAEDQSRQAYLGQVYVMRAVRLIADTIAQLPWVAGMDPTDPSAINPSAPLANLLGPATPQAPGGPNPVTSARAFWAWSIIQYVVTGRFAWECQLDGSGPKSQQDIIGLWPLVSAAIAPKPTTGQGGTQWFNGYEYTPATGKIELTNEQVIYCWRPSILDWRLPESMLMSAQYPIYIANAVNRYMANLLKNDLVATTLIVTPPIEEADQRRAWQDQFLSKFSGVDNGGNTIFAEAEADENDTAGKPLIQVERIAQSVMDASLKEMSDTAKEEICLCLGTPKSLLGDSSERTFSNASNEWMNFWTTTLLDLVTEIQDHVNLNLAPRLGKEVGWFDLSHVEALKPAAVFAPPDITEAIQTGVASPEQIASLLGIPPQPDDPAAVPNAEDSTTAPRSAHSLEWRQAVQRHYLRQSALAEYERGLPVNTWTLRGLRKAPEMPRERIVLQERAIPARAALSTTGKGIRQAEIIRQQAAEVREVMAARRAAELEAGDDWSARSDLDLDRLGDELALGL